MSIQKLDTQIPDKWFVVSKYLSGICFGILNIQNPDFKLVLVKFSIVKKILDASLDN